MGDNEENDTQEEEHEEEEDNSEKLGDLEKALDKLQEEITQDDSLGDQLESLKKEILEMKDIRKADKVESLLEKIPEAKRKVVQESIKEDGLDDQIKVLQRLSKMEGIFDGQKQAQGIIPGSIPEGEFEPSEDWANNIMKQRGYTI